MTQTSSRPDQPAAAPPGVCGALAELVQIGLTVARLVGRTAEVEITLADNAAQAAAADGASPLATSLAEAIEADRAAAAAAEARQTVVARTEAVARAFARVSRAIRLTVAQTERLDRGWAQQRSAADDHPAMARRQIARGVADAIAREAEGERAVQLTTALRERMEALDTESGLDHGSAAEITTIICRDLGLDPVRMTNQSPRPQRIDAAEMGEAAPPTVGLRDWPGSPPQRRPDG